MNTKRYKVTYFLYPEAENIIITISARNYEEACVLAKAYRKETFAIVCESTHTAGE